MARKRRSGRKSGRVSVHAVLDADVAARLRSYAGYHGRDVSDVVAEGVKVVMKGFSARQDGPRQRDEDSPGLGLVAGTEAA